MPLSCSDSSSACCFAQYTISLRNRQNNLIFSLATQLSFQSIIPKYMKKKGSMSHLCLLSAPFPCQGICKSIALTILSTNYLRMPVMSPTANALLINNASGSGEGFLPPPWHTIKETACSWAEHPGFSLWGPSQVDGGVLAAGQQGGWLCRTAWFAVQDAAPPCPTAWH